MGSNSELTAELAMAMGLAGGAAIQAAENVAGPGRPLGEALLASGAIDPPALARLQAAERWVLEARAALAGEDAAPGELAAIRAALDSGQLDRGQLDRALVRHASRNLDAPLSETLESTGLLSAEAAATVRTAAAAPPPAQLLLVIVEGPGTGSELPVPAGAPLLLGRHAEAQLQLADGSASSRHATVSATADGLRVIDCSANGTFIEGTRLAPEGLLRPGQRMVAGETTLELRRTSKQAPAPPPAPAPADEPPAPFELLGIGGSVAGQRLALRVGETRLGRRQANDHVLIDPKISGEHCTVHIVDGRVSLTDHSANGSYVAGEKVHKRKVPLVLGMPLQLGAIELQLVERGEAARPLYDLVGVAGAVSGQRFPLPMGTLSLGSDPGCDLLIGSPSVAARHATMQVESAWVTIEDASSQGATSGGEHRAGAAPLAVGQKLSLGDCALVLVRSGQAPPEDLTDATLYLAAPFELIGRAGGVAGQRFSLGLGVTRIGRSADADVPIDDPRASGNHCRLEVGRDRVQLEDCSANGTLLDGQPVGEPVEIAPGATLTIGELVFELARVAAPGAAPTAGAAPSSTSDADEDPLDRTVMLPEGAGAELDGTVMLPGAPPAPAPGAIRISSPRATRLPRPRSQPRLPAATGGKPSQALTAVVIASLVVAAIGVLFGLGQQRGRTQALSQASSLRAELESLSRRAAAPDPEVDALRAQARRLKAAASMASEEAAQSARQRIEMLEAKVTRLERAATQAALSAIASSRHASSRPASSQAPSSSGPRVRIDEARMGWPAGDQRYTYRITPRTSQGPGKPSRWQVSARQLGPEGKLAATQRQHLLLAVALAVPNQHVRQDSTFRLRRSFTRLEDVDALDAVIQLTHTGPAVHAGTPCERLTLAVTLTPSGRAQRPARITKGSISGTMYWSPEQRRVLGFEVDARWTLRAKGKTTREAAALTATLLRAE